MADCIRDPKLWNQVRPQGPRGLAGIPHLGRKKKARLREGITISCSSSSQSGTHSTTSRSLTLSALFPAPRPQVLPIGGPGKALSAKEQGEMLFEVLGKEPKFISVRGDILLFSPLLCVLFCVFLCCAVSAGPAESRWLSAAPCAAEACARESARVLR